MPPLPATLSPVVNRILTGYFQENIGYSTVRRAGTNDWLLIYTIRGSGDFGVGHDEAGTVAERFTTAPGDAVLIHPGVLHNYRVHQRAQRWDLLWAHFHPRPDWSAWMDWPPARPECPGLMRLSTPKGTMRRQIEDALHRMNRLAISSYRQRDYFALNALEEVLLWCSTQLLNGSADKLDPRIVQAQEYLCQHLRESVTLNELADIVGLSVSRLSHLFHKHAGITPQRYYELQRLERARHLLELTAIPVKQVATEVGFENPFYFTLRFKRHTGKSPRAYRQAAVV